MYTVENRLFNGIPSICPTQLTKLEKPQNKLSFNPYNSTPRTIYISSQSLNSPRSKKLYLNQQSLFFVDLMTARATYVSTTSKKVSQKSGKWRGRNKTTLSGF